VILPWTGFAHGPIRTCSCSASPFVHHRSFNPGVCSQCVAFGVPSDKTIQPKDADAPMHSSREGSFTTLTGTFHFSLEISEMFVWYRKIIKFMSICRDYTSNLPTR